MHVTSLFCVTWDVNVSLVVTCIKNLPINKYEEAHTFRVVLLGLLEVGLQELGEGALLCQELLVAPPLGDLSVLYHDDLIHFRQERNGVGHKHPSLKYQGSLNFQDQSLGSNGSEVAERPANMTIKKWPPNAAACRSISCFLAIPPPPSPEFLYLLLYRPHM